MNLVKLTSFMYTDYMSEVKFDFFQFACYIFRGSILIYITLYYLLVFLISVII